MHSSKMRNAYHWLGIVSNVTEIYKKCATCLVKQPYNMHVNVQKLKSTLTTKPFAWVDMDLLGLLIPIVQGHQYITGCVDYLTEWV